MLAAPFIHREITVTIIPASAPLGLIGGLGRMAGADAHAKLLRGLAAGGAQSRGVLFEQAYRDPASTQDLGTRKRYAHDMAQRLRRRGAGSILLPCFISHTFMAELEAEAGLPIVNMMQALLAHLGARPGKPRVVGVLATDQVRHAQLFESAFAAAGHAVRTPGAAIQADCVMPAIYGRSGLQRRGPGSQSIALLRIACADLMAQGAEVIVAGATEIAMLAAALNGHGYPVLDSTQVYVDYALARAMPAMAPAPARAFTVGIVGGIGPAATVDFMDKIVRHTAARRDQDHLRLLVDHNPAIPDRTAHLTGSGADPMLALYAACKRLEAGGASVIAMPCNTAHAYLDQIRPGLSLPVVDMLAETVAHIAASAPGCRKVGLLATSGTLASRVYHDAAHGAPFELLVPEPAFQQRVMDAIYGDRGVKAGHTTGACVDDLAAAMAHLAQRGATVLILGCTELPLLAGQQRGYLAGGHPVDLVDPTLIMAQRCIALARAAQG